MAVSYKKGHLCKSIQEQQEGEVILGTGKKLVVLLFFHLFQIPTVENVKMTCANSLMLRAIRCLL